MLNLLESSAPRRLLAAAWFGLVAFLASALFFFHRPIAPAAVILYVVLPGVAGAIAGAIWGASILDFSKPESQSKTWGGSLLRGLGVTLAAYVIFAVFFAVGVTLSGDTIKARVPELFVLTLTFGFLMVGPFMLVVGAAAAATLHWFGYYTTKRHAIAGD